MEGGGAGRGGEKGYEGEEMGMKTGLIEQRMKWGELRKRKKMKRICS